MIMDVDYFNRYQRQIQLKEFGLEAQQKLSAAKVLIVGMGGLGCPAAQYLVGAGVGKIGLVDGDKIELHNLHRQVLYATEDVGKLKVEVAKRKLQALNPTINIELFKEHITAQNIFDIAADYDVVLDGTDQLATRYLLDQYCVLESKVYVYGSVYAFEGQVALFDYAQNEICYQSLFPNPPKPSDVPTCSENGILGFVPSIIGCMQALELVKYLCGIAELTAELVHYNALNQQLYKTRMSKNAQYVAPQSSADLKF
jgi:sulfur-carrier protein adenylyltransferase/sulfurtransferase